LRVAVRREPLRTLKGDGQYGAASFEVRFVGTSGMTKIVRSGTTG
jgi:hypothetical protein